MNNIFSDNLKKFRLAKGLTQEQVAKKLNVNSQTDMMEKHAQEVRRKIAL